MIQQGCHLLADSPHVFHHGGPSGAFAPLLGELWAVLRCGLEFARVERVWRVVRDLDVWEVHTS